MHATFSLATRPWNIAKSKWVCAIENVVARPIPPAPACVYDESHLRIFLSEMSFITTNQPTFFKCFAVALLAALPGSWRLLVAGEGLPWNIECGLIGLVACKRFRFSLTIGSLNSLAEDFADEMRLISIFKYSNFDENYRIQIAKFTSLSKAPLSHEKTRYQPSEEMKSLRELTGPAQWFSSYSDLRKVLDGAIKSRKMS